MFIVKCPPQAIREHMVSVLQHQKPGFMHDEAFCRVIQLIKVSPRQLHLAILVTVAIKYFCRVVITLCLVNQLAVAVHDF